MRGRRSDPAALFRARQRSSKTTFSVTWTSCSPAITPVALSCAARRAIIIGRGGSRLREVGTTAREGIEKLLGQRVYLDLHVKVAKDWQRDPKQLGKLGFNF